MYDFSQLITNYNRFRLERYILRRQDSAISETAAASFAEKYLETQSVLI